MSTTVSPANPNGQAQTQGPATPNGQPRVLVVDDSLTVRMDLQEGFQHAGFAVVACENMASARAALQEQIIALVVLDVLLPDGDGIELLREIKQRGGPPIPVMLLSTEAEVRDRVRGLKTGADDYVGKPYDLGYLLARARELLDACFGPAAEERILVIDDSPTFRDEFRGVLEAAGYQVVTAAAGEEGLQAAFVQRPDAILVDMVMPGALDGRAVIRRLKQDAMLHHTPCLLLTGSAEQGEELRVLEAGADAYLSKDTDRQEMLARLAALLRFNYAPRSLESPSSSLLGANKILAVDDSPTFLNEVAAQLRQEGYDVIQAGSGRDALELLEVQKVDCVLLDVRMPELSGYDVCRRIKARPALRNIPLLMLTVLDEPEAVIEGINCGADDYVCKSSDFSVLKARVRAQLRRRQFEQEYRGLREKLLQQELETERAHAAQQVAEARAALVDELEEKNRELEAFAYAAAHDLHAPLRVVRGFSQAIFEEFASQLPAGALQHLARVQAGAERMNRLIDALLELSRSSRAELHRESVDLTALARALAAELAESEQGRTVEWRIAERLRLYGDPALLRLALQNLLSNAWKFTAGTAAACIELGAPAGAGPAVYYVRDNGVGFDAVRAQRLFEPFERLHPATEFPGAGIGLATVRRIIERHGGRIWAESKPGQGATFFFTLPGAPAGPGNGPVRSVPDPASHSPAAGR